jgi:peroxiredoxin
LVQLAQVLDQIEAKGGQLWAISPQTVADNQALRDQYDLPFPILADADQSVIRQWGLFNELDPKQRPIPYPATYIVGKNGRILYRNLGLTTRDRPTPAEIIAALPEA